VNPEQNTDRTKKLPEPCNGKELLLFWLLHAHKGRDRHDKAARRNDKFFYWLGVPAVIISAVVGTSIFATLDEQVGSEFKVILGLVSIASAILLSLQTFANFGSRAESHRLTGVKYKNVIRELEQIFAGQLEQYQDDAEFLDKLRNRLDALETEAPIVPESIYAVVEGDYKDAKFADTVECFINRG
jgi:hypothetical protein